MENSMLKITPLWLFVPLLAITSLLISCGESSSKKDKTTDNLPLPSEEIIIPKEEEFASTLLFPGNKSLYLGSSVGLVGTVKPKYIGKVSSIKVETADGDFSPEIDTEGIWRIASVPLKKQLTNDISVQVTLFDGAEFTDKYTVIRSVPLQGASNPLISKDGRSAIFSNSSVGSIFSIDLNTSLVEILVDSSIGSKISWGPEEGVVYGYVGSLNSLNLNTSEEIEISDLDLRPDDDFVSAHGSSDDIDYDPITNELFLLIGAGTDGEKIELGLPQAQIIFNVDLQAERLVEFSGALKGSGERFYNGFQMDIDKKSRKIYVADNAIGKGLYQVDMITGARTKVLDDLHYPIGSLAVDEARSQVYFSTFDTGIVKFDPANNEETTIFESENFPKLIRHLETNTIKDELLVMSTAYESLHAGDLVSGQIRTIIPPLRDAYSFINPKITKFAIDSKTGLTYLISEYSNYVGVISPDSKRVRKLSGISGSQHLEVGSGPSLRRTTDIYFNRDSSQLYISNEYGQIFKVNVANGNRSLIQPIVETGAEIKSVTSMTVDEVNKLIYIADNESDKIVVLNISSNTQSLLTNYRQSGEEIDLVDVLDMAVDHKEKTLWISQREFNSGYFRFPLIALDLDTSHRVPAYEVEHSSDLNFSVSSLAIDTVTNDLYLGSSGKVYQFNIDNWALRQYADAAIGDTRVLYSQNHIEVHPGAGVIYINGGGIYAIDMESQQSARFY